MKVISIVNQKGGVGKTTAGVNIAAILALNGYRVLVVDLDPQGDTTHYSGIKEEALKYTTKEFLLDKELHKEAIIKTDNYDLIGTDITLADAEIQLISEFNREFILKRKLKLLSTEYDFCIIDCPPSLSLLSINALIASDLSLSPVLLETFSIKGVNSLLATIEKIRSANEKLIMKIFVNKFDKRLKHNGEYLEQIKEYCSPFLLKTIIRTDTEISKSQTVSKNLHDYNTKAKSSEDFSLLVKELEEIL